MAWLNANDADYLSERLICIDIRSDHPIGSTLYTMVYLSRIV